jgi:putative tryptophan/tyrosine transport system substrate-binding protein
VLRMATIGWPRVQATVRPLVRFAALLLCLCGPCAAIAAGAQGGIAVLYPEVAEPYRAVFAKIIEAIEGQSKSPMTSFALGPGANAQNIMSELRRQDIRVVIALGRNGLKLAANLDADIGVVAGGVVSIPEAEARNFAVLSLAPAPALLFSRLHGFMPGAKRIFVVYDPNQNAWLIRLAKEAATARGIELIAYEASDLKTALGFYKEIFAAAQPKTDALWLPQDSSTVDENVVLPLVLQEAWSRNLTFFSSNVGHVRRGALFSLYPNNADMGRTLANTAFGALASGARLARGVTPLKEVQIAVNTRTADHLGINLPRMQQSFDLVFPEP